MKKSDVTMHSDFVSMPRGGYSRGNPAINVKVHGLYIAVTAADVARRFNCSEATAERALQFQFDAAQTVFWEDARERATKVFGAQVKIYSEGRSGGWLTLHNLPEVESWDAIMLGRYARMVRWCEMEIIHLNCAHYVLGEIDANQWHKEGAEAYNFIDGADGRPQCIADLKQAAIAAGFAPVVRK